MGRSHLCYWIPGIQPGLLDVDTIRRATVSVSTMLPPEIYIHKVFNWEDEFDKRQKILCSIGKKYGNWLVRKIKEGKINLGMDMGWYLNTKRGYLPGFLFGDLHSRLQTEIKDDLEMLASRNFDSCLHLISHSWGTKVALDFAINNPTRDVHLVTMGSPLLDLSGGYEDWGDPDKIKNIKSWVNIFYPNDPICTGPMYENPGPNKAKWETFVEDIILSNKSLLPIRSHTKYWKDKACFKAIAGSLTHK